MPPPHGSTTARVKEKKSAKRRNAGGEGKSSESGRAHPRHRHRIALVASERDEQVLSRHLASAEIFGRTSTNPGGRVVF